MLAEVRPGFTRESESGCGRCRGGLLDVQEALLILDLQHRGCALVPEGQQQLAFAGVGVVEVDLDDAFFGLRGYITGDT